jgi:hypothetical protein
MILPVILALFLQFSCPDLGATAWCAIPATNAVEQPEPQSAARPAATGEELTGLPRGKKLVLKDGSYQLVRSYEKKGERVRYFSVERDAWEEIPAAIVDWDATKKAGEADEKAAAALLEKTRIQEAAANAQTPIDVDASLLVAPGVFLPDGEGMFAIEGKSVKRLEQAGSEVKADRKTVLKQILSPIPIVPSKHNVELPGARAAVRLMSAVPEFYLREPAPDQDQDSTVLRSSRQGAGGPDVALVRAKVKGNKRLLESIRNLFGQQLSQDREEIAVQRWEVAPDIYRFTLSAPLPPGEYALAEILQDGLNLYVWDFGVDASPAATSAAHKSK